MAVYGDNGKILATRDNEIGKGYVEAESDRLAASVRAVQSDKTLTMISISDMHYRDDVADIRAAIEDMADGVKNIRRQIHADYDVSYGDIIYAMWATDGRTDRVSYADGVTDAIAAEKKQFDAFGTHRQIRLVGNHDVNATDSSGTKYFGMDMLYSLFGSYNDCLTRPESYRNRSYGYIDDDYRKLRLICLNTSDFGSGSPNKGASGNLNYYMSAEQVAWLVETLDLSDKEDADEWQIFVMAHMAMDQKTLVNNGYPALIKAYEDGSSGSLLDVAYDFSGGKNAAKLALYIHGHTHAYTVDNVHVKNGSNYPKIKTPRLSIPNALPGRDTGADAADSNGIVWGIGAAFPKTPGTKDSTAFVVNTIDPVNKIVYSHHYGAGLDRILHYDPQTISAATTLTPSITATSWATLDSSVATVSSGTVTPVASGNVMVYAKDKDGTREYFNLAVSV